MRALWPDRPNCSHNVSQKLKRIRRLSEVILNEEEKPSLAGLWEKGELGAFKRELG